MKVSKKYLIISSIIFTLICLVAIIKKTKENIQNERAFHTKLHNINIKTPNQKPSISQESIDKAMALFGITIGSDVMWPTLDKTLDDRGLTVRGVFMTKAQVTIGPAAFSSWALLGSTLGHEIEVHCKQNFLLVYVMDVLGFEGINFAERQAYEYELSNNERFGLDAYDVDMISSTLEYYYPKKDMNNFISKKSKITLELGSKIKNIISSNVMEN